MHALTEKCCQKPVPMCSRWKPVSDSHASLQNTTGHSSAATSTSTMPSLRAHVAGRHEAGMGEAGRHGAGVREAGEACGGEARGRDG